MVDQLTNEQAKQLGEKLINTTYNVYRVCYSMFGIEEADESVFEQLRVISGIFKCEECNRWKSLSHKNPHLESTCEECADYDDELE